MSHFQLRTLRLVGEEDERAWRFRPGVTVIVGPVGVGKTSLFELIKYGLGGDGVLTRAVRAAGVRVTLEVELETGIFVLERRLHRSTGRVAIIHPDGTPVRTLPLRGRADQQTLSDWLLGNIGIPALRLPRSRSRRSSGYTRVSFTDVLTYLYLEQHEIDRSTARSLDKVLEPKRRQTFEVLYRLTGPEIAELTARRDGLDGRLAEQRARVREIESFLGGLDEAETLGSIRAQAAQIDGRRAQVDHELAVLAKQARQASGAADAARLELELAEDKLEQARRRSTERFAELETLVHARAAAVVDHQRVAQGITAQAAMRVLEFSQCPRCLQALDVEHPTDNCRLCGQPEPPRLGPDVLDRERLRLEEQVIETDGLIETARRRLADSEREVAELREAAAIRRTRIDREAASAVAPFVEAIGALREEVGRLRERERNLRERLRRHEQLQRMRDEADATARELDDVEARLAAAKADRERGRERVQDFSDIFRSILERFELPWYRSARIDLETYLPVVNEGSLTELSSGGMKTQVNDAYYLANLNYALQQPDEVHTPPFLIIDSPRKNIGAGPKDRQASRRIYSFIDVLLDSYRDRMQLLIADNDLPTEFRRRFRVWPYDYEKPVISDVRHPGRGQVRTVEQLKDERTRQTTQGPRS